MTSVPDWMLFNILSNITFWLQNNLNVIIQICSTVYLSRTVLFTSIQLEGVPTFLLATIGIISIGSTNLKFPPKTAQKGSTPYCHFSMTIRTLITILNFIKLY